MPLKAVYTTNEVVRRFGVGRCLLNEWVARRKVVPKYLGDRQGGRGSRRLFSLQQARTMQKWYRAFLTYREATRGQAL